MEQEAVFQRGAIVGGEGDAWDGALRVKGVFEAVLGVLVLVVLVQEFVFIADGFGKDESVCGAVIWLEAVLEICVHVLVVAVDDAEGDWNAGADVVVLATVLEVVVPPLAELQGAGDGGNAYVEVLILAAVLEAFVSGVVVEIDGIDENEITWVDEVILDNLNETSARELGEMPNGPKGSRGACVVIFQAVQEILDQGPARADISPVCLGLI